MSTPSSSGSPYRALAALAAAALVAAAAAAIPPRAAAGATGAGGDGKPPLTSGTCAVCHTDPRYRGAFSHRGLEQSADGCLTCHAPGDGHVAARGGKGSIATPKSLDAGAERGLCLQCHEEETYAAPKHLEPMGKDARCTDCHVVHDAAKPVRGAPPAPPPGPAVAPLPAKGKAWAHGRAEAGWRFVRGEKGRYEQDVNLEDGPRLFSAGLEAGLDDADPRAPRVEARLDGLGDPHASARILARRSDDWRLSLSARRDEQPFVGGGGLHPGETLRETLDAEARFRVSDGVRAAAGWSATDHEGDLRATVFDAGSVLAAEQDLDRRTQEAWASVDLASRGWRAGLRQGWLWEDGDDDRHRDLDAPGAPDSLAFDDDSRMQGPVTSVTAGADLLGGALSVDARASRSDLDREVDVAELRRGTLGSGPYTRRETVEGDRQREVDLVALDLSLALGARWAAEAEVERRALREDGALRDRSSVDVGSGPTGSTTSHADRVSQRVLRETLGMRYAMAGGFTFRGGAEVLHDALEAGPGMDLDHRARSTGLYAGAAGPVSGPLSVRAELRTVRTDEAFTPLTPEERDDLLLGAAWRDPEGFRAGAEVRLSQLSASDSDLASRGKTVRLSLGRGKEDEVSWDLSWTSRQLGLEADTLATVGTSLQAGRASSTVRSHVVEGTLGIPVSPRVRLTAGTAWVREQGDLPVTAWDATLGVRWQVTGSTAIRIQVRRRKYDEGGSNALDYGATILEVSVEAGF
jgi:hypothetical protein